ncbi:thioesterase [Allostella vacuolata]|nr:thioesterase [Stella vacuolata]
MPVIEVPPGFEEIPPRTDRYSANLGPFYRKEVEEGRWLFGFRVEERHLNSNSVVHGGCLMSFADEMLGITVHFAAGRRRCATISLNNEFVTAAKLGDWVLGTPEVVRVTKSVVFVRGTLTVDDKIILASSGIWKLLGQH